MNTTDETELREATQLLREIDGNPMHPANDSRHPDHEACLKAYQELEAWVMEQHGGTNKP